MLTVLSPAKTLDFETPPTTRKSTQPLFVDQAAALVEDARGLDPAAIQKLMGVSEKIAELNFQRFHDWVPEFSLDNAKQAVLAFKGDVYTGLRAETLDSKQLAFAQKHLRILSGLYGLLRPLDLMQPYRLEMGLKFANSGGKNLYDFWGQQITDTLNKHIKASGSPVLVNLASNEYFKAVKPKAVAAEIITPAFKDLKNGKYKMISFYAKKARGLMANYIITEGLNDPEGLKDFAVEGYYYSPEQSTATEWVFLRDEAPAS
ncbi:MAG: peroxide stress protein YaaA [Halieaceae bacterium]|nr:peroxide stress protein YaaA [Halieaceae bacterium]